MNGTNIYRTYLPVDGGKFHLDGGVLGEPRAACSPSVALDESTLSLLGGFHGGPTAFHCRRCARMMEA